MPSEDEAPVKTPPWWLTLLKALWRRIKGEKTTRDLIKRAIAAAVTAAVATAAVVAGVIVNNELDDLQTRVDAVEGRPVLDLGPVRANTRRLSNRVEELHDATLAMLRRLRDGEFSAGELAADAQALADDVRSASVDLASLSGQVQATADASDGVQQEIAQQLADLAETTADATEALGEQLSDLDIRLQEVRDATQQHAQAIRAATTGARCSI